MYFKNTKKGFTLIELLVVIAVIALLMSVMVPALRKAKEKAKQVTCSSNLRQIALGLVAYAQNNNDCIPENAVGFPYDMNGGYGPWRGMGLLYIRGYISEPKTFYCPSDKVILYGVDTVMSSGTPYKTIYPGTEYVEWRILSSYTYRRGAGGATLDDCLWPTGNIKLADIRSTSGFVGDTGCWAAQANAAHITNHFDRLFQYSYADGHVESFSLWPAPQGPDRTWWDHWIDRTEFNRNWPIPSGKGPLPECPYIGNGDIW